ECGMLMCSAAQPEAARIDHAVATAREVGAEEQAVALDPEAVAERIRSPVFRRGVFYPEGATVHPGRPVIALRRAAIEAGVDLREHSPASAVRDGVVTTP